MKQLLKNKIEQFLLRVKIPYFSFLVLRNKELEERAKQLEKKIEETIQLQTRVSNLESLFQYSVIRNIDLVSYYGDLYFWYTKDQSYEWLKPAPSARINYTPSEKDFILPESCEYTITESYEKYDLNQSKLFEMDLKNFLFLHLWLNEIDFTYVDIGANVGTTTVPAAKFFQKYQRENKIISFEPGIVYDLLKNTIKINRISELVTLEKLAIGNETKPVVIKSLLEHSESNSIIDFSTDSPDMLLASCNLVDSVRLDEYIQEKQIKNDLVIKIDTEGNDWFVIQGMNKLIPQQVAIIIMEYTPTLLQKFIEPEDVLNYLNGEYLLLNMLTFTPYPYWRCSLIGEDMNSFKKFAQQVKEFSRGWTDVLALRRNLPNLNLLTTRLTNNLKNNWFTKDN